MDFTNVKLELLLENGLWNGGCGSELVCLLHTFVWSMSLLIGFLTVLKAYTRRTFAPTYLFVGDSLNSIMPRGQDVGLLQGIKDSLHAASIPILQYIDDSPVFINSYIRMFSMDEIENSQDAVLSEGCGLEYWPGRYMGLPTSSWVGKINWCGSHSLTYAVGDLLCGN